MTALLVNTSRYILLDGTQRYGPKLLPSQYGAEAVAIYGFSTKRSYDLFCANSELALTPYPLLKGYLKRELANSGHSVHLVVADAAGPNEAQLNAATMNCVLEALEQRSDRVAISFRLLLDQDSQGYRTEKASPGLSETSRDAGLRGELQSYPEPFPGQRYEKDQTLQ